MFSYIPHLPDAFILTILFVVYEVYNAINLACPQI